MYFKHEVISSVYRRIAALIKSFQPCTNLVSCVTSQNLKPICDLERKVFKLCFGQKNEALNKKGLSTPENKKELQKTRKDSPLKTSNLEKF